MAIGCAPFMHVSGESSVTNIESGWTIAKVLVSTVIHRIEIYLLFPSIRKTIVCYGRYLYED